MDIKNMTPNEMIKHWYACEAQMHECALCGDIFDMTNDPNSPIFGVDACI